MTIVKLLLLLPIAAEPGLPLMLLDVRCSFLYGMRRKVYIELPRQDPWYGEGPMVGKSKDTMYGWHGEGADVGLGLECE